MLAEARVLAKLLRLDTADNLLGLGYEVVKLLIRADVEPLEPLKEIAEVRDRRVAEDLRFAVLLAAEPFGKVFHKPGQFVGKGLLREFDGFTESRLHPLALLAVEFRREALEVGRGFDGRKL